jgi:hypothetical protein
MEGIRYIRQFSFTDRRTHFAEQLHYRTSVLVLDKRCPPVTCGSHYPNPHINSSTAAHKLA